LACMNNCATEPGVASMLPPSHATHMAAVPTSRPTWQAKSRQAARVWGGESRCPPGIAR
jgi:hypothetical protein